jgi:hypothetical protein
MNNVRLENALSLASHGLRIFPLAANSKIPPAGLPWKEAATTDPAAIRRWVKQYPGCNFAVAAGGGITILDADTKNGKQGLASLEMMRLMDLPHSFQVMTPSGGRHWYLRTATKHRNSVDALVGYPGIDVRSDGGYTVAPGSEVNGMTYAAVGDPASVAEMPAWLEKVLVESTAKQHKPKSAQPLVELDQEHHIELARGFLRERAPEAIEGAGGDHQTYEVACVCREYGLSEGMVLDVMLECWNSEKASPPWQAEHLQAKVSNAFEYATGGWGARTAQAEFEVVEIDIGERPTRAAITTAPSIETPNASAGAASKWSFETVSMLRSLPQLKWLAKGWVPENSTGIFYGKWASGKTFVVFDLALHLAYGFSDWHGVKLPGEPCKVLIIAREGHTGFVDRIDAFKRHHGIDSDTEERLVFMRAPISFMNTEEFRDFARTLKAQKAAFRLNIVDTVARVMAGTDMIEAPTITAFMERCAVLTEVTGGTTIGVHHQNKGGSMYGSIFFEANADFVFEITRGGEAHEPLSEGEILCTKMKDGEDRWRRYLQYEKVGWTAGEDEPKSSLVLAAVTTTPSPATTASELAQRALDIISSSYELGNRLSRHPRARSNGRYAGEVIAKSLRIDEKSAVDLVNKLIDAGRVLERYDTKLKSRYLVGSDVADEPEWLAETGGDAAETQEVLQGEL